MKKTKRNDRSYERRYNVGCYLELKSKKELEAAAKKGGVSVSLFIAQALAAAIRRAA